MKFALTNANLIDCVSPGVRQGCTVTVEDGHIAEILDGGGAPLGQDVETIDLGGSYLLPGLWDVHVHLEWPRIAAATDSELTVQYAYNAARGLTDAGVVGIRTGGTPQFIDVALKRAFASGQHVGPRVFADGWFLTTTGGHFLTSGAALECDGAVGFVRAIRPQIESGVDHIKLNLTGGIMGPHWDRHQDSFLLEDELEAAFAISKQRGYGVMAHAASPDAVKAAVRHGAHTVEHGYIMDEECIELFLESGTWYVPTLGITHLTRGQAATSWETQWAEDRDLAPDLSERADAASDEHREWFRRALDAGVKMALGSDLRPLHEGTLMEMGLWVKDGATTWQTLVAATRNAAELCGVGDSLGTIEVGKLADMIVVGKNPLDDIDNVRDLKMVFKEGGVVADHRERAT